MQGLPELIVSAINDGQEGSPAKLKKSPSRLAKYSARQEAAEARGSNEML